MHGIPRKEKMLFIDKNGIAKETGKWSSLKKMVSTAMAL